MNKLLNLLGEDRYNKLKEFMGDGFSEFEAKFENDEITVDDINGKLAEAGIESVPTEQEVGGADNTNSDGESENSDTSENADTTVTDDDVSTEVKTDDTLGVENVLLDGWLEGGKCDTSKIVYAPLKEFIDGLLKIVNEADWLAAYKIAVMSEAMKQGMHNIDDAVEFIGIEQLSRDDDGNVIGVKEAFDKLKSNKPYLFKNQENADNGILDKGFSPTDKKVVAKPRSYAEAVEATKNMLNN